jgi:hypothetical protein
MVLSKSELLASLHHEVNVLLHLVGKIDRSQLDYRPTAKQRSTIELLRYLALMGPAMAAAGATGAFDRGAWSATVKELESKDVDALAAVIATHPARYDAVITPLADEAFRDEIEVFGRKSTRGLFMVKQLLGNCVGYRMQLFLYLKACGAEELGTSNLWHGVDPAPKT